MEVIAYYDGQIGSPDELVVPFNDRSHFFGDGVYDATMGANGKVFLLDEHIDRFFASADIFDMKVPLCKQELGALLTDLIGKVDGPSYLVYWQITRGTTGLRSHSYDEAAPCKLWAITIPDPMGNPLKPLKAITMEDKRFGYCNAKTLNLMPAVLYAQAASKADAYETILHRDGIVTECAHSNVSILKDGVFRSHPNDEHILRGIAKTHLIQACHKVGVPVVEQPFTLEQLMDADEIIITASSHLCSFVNDIDGIPVGGRDPETLRQLREVVFGEYLDFMGFDELPR